LKKGITKNIFGSHPSAPKLIALKRMDVQMFKNNSIAIRQILAMISNNNDLSGLPGMNAEIDNAMKFLDDMVFLFGKIENVDAVKIEK
jgi:hypothetical protein